MLETVEAVLTNVEQGLEPDISVATLTAANLVVVLKDLAAYPPTTVLDRLFKPIQR